MTVDERTTAEQAVLSAVLDYFEGWFDGDAARMERALHPGLAKRSLGRDGRTLDEITAGWMSTRRDEGSGVNETPATAGSRSRSRTFTGRSRTQPSAPRCTGSTFSSCERLTGGKS